MVRGSRDLWATGRLALPVAFGCPLECFGGPAAGLLGAFLGVPHRPGRPGGATGGLPLYVEVVPYQVALGLVEGVVEGFVAVVRLQLLRSVP